MLSVFASQFIAFQSHNQKRALLTSKKVLLIYFLPLCFPLALPLCWQSCKSSLSCQGRAGFFTLCASSPVAGRPHAQRQCWWPAGGCWFALVHPLAAEVRAVSNACGAAAPSCSLTCGASAVRTAKRGKGLWRADSIQSSTRLGRIFSGNEVCKGADQGKCHSCVLL